MEGGGGTWYPLIRRRWCARRAQRSGSSARAGIEEWNRVWGRPAQRRRGGGEKLCKGVEQLLTCLPVREEVQMRGKESKDGRREGVREILHRDIQHKMLHHL